MRRQGSQFTSTDFINVDLSRFCSGQVLMLSGPLLEGHG